jgi:hypothetical protein
VWSSQFCGLAFSTRRGIPSPPIHQTRSGCGSLTFPVMRKLESIPYLVNTGPGNAGLKTNVFWIWGGFCVRTCSGFHLLRFHLLRLDLAIVVGRLDSDVADLWP